MNPGLFGRFIFLWDENGINFHYGLDYYTVFSLFPQGDLWSAHSFISPSMRSRYFPASNPSQLLPHVPG